MIAWKETPRFIKMIVLVLAWGVALLSMLSVHQDIIIQQETNLIRAMMQNPNCAVGPVSVPKAIPPNVKYIPNFKGVSPSDN